MAGRKHKAAIAGAAALALAAGGVGVAQAVGGGDSDESATGPDAERAKAAGVDAAGGGQAIEVERADEGASGWEVEVKRADGSVLEVNLDDKLQKTGVAPSDDGPNDREDEGEREGGG